jgi:hypothetical protein
MADQKKQPFAGFGAYFPGQKGLLSDQLSWGFGHSPTQWGKYLDSTYSRMQPIPDYPYTTPPTPDKPGKKPDKPGKPDDPGTDNGDDGWTGNSHSALLPMMTGLPALGASTAQTMPQQNTGMPQSYAASPNPQYAQLAQQMMQQQPNGLMALNPQALAFLRQYGGR